MGDMGLVHIGRGRAQLLTQRRHPASVAQGHLRGRQPRGVHRGGAGDGVQQLPGHHGLLPGEALLGHGSGHGRRQQDGVHGVSGHGHRSGRGSGGAQQRRVAACSGEDGVPPRRHDV